MGVRNSPGTVPAWLKANEGRHLCGCGCGKAIPLRRVHFYDGIPPYLQGHHLRARSKPKPTKPCACGCDEVVTSPRSFAPGHRRNSPETRAKIRESWARKRAAKPPLPVTACECGCGELARPGNRYLRGHQRRGARGAGYVGHHIDTAGYVQVLVDNHPFGYRGGKKVLEHRLVAETYLREHQPDSPFLRDFEGELYLRREVHVHHRNGDRTDNRIENLEPMWASDHAKLTRQQSA